MKNSTFIVILLSVYTIMFPPPVFAYLDPGSGAYLLQILAAGFFVGLFFVKNTWSKIKGFAKNMIGKGEEKVEEEPKHKK